MTFQQSKKLVLKVLQLWHKPSVVQTMTTQTGETFTLEMLLDTVNGIRRNPPLSVQVVVPPNIMERFTETTVNPAFYGTIRITADPTCPPDQAYMIQSPE